MIKIDLLIIDPQEDFCNPNGSLYVKNAENDMGRIAALINRTGHKLHDIHVTLDTHHYIDVAHPIFWKNSKGDHPDPFTIISKDDVINGKWITTLPSLQKRMINYVTTLENNGRYPLCIWPPHCLIGSEGHKVSPILYDILLKWEETQFAMVNYVTKGSNIYTEHYSAVQADVIDPIDPTTQLNQILIDALKEVDMIAVCGEASSHCVLNTVKDIIANFNDDAIKKFTILEDGMSPVSGFEQNTIDFFSDLKAKGVSFTKTSDFLR